MQRDTYLSSTGRPQVLIVEDNHLIAEAFRVLLEDEGFTATHVASGLEAQAALRRSSGVLFISVQEPQS